MLTSGSGLREYQGTSTHMLNVYQLSLHKFNDYITCGTNKIIHTENEIVVHKYVATYRPCISLNTNNKCYTDFVCQQKGHACTEDGCGESYSHRKYLKYHSESLYKNITEILRKGGKRFLYQSWPGQNSMCGRT